MICSAKATPTNFRHKGKCPHLQNNTRFSSKTTFSDFITRPARKVNTFRKIKVKKATFYIYLQFKKFNNHKNYFQNKEVNFCCEFPFGEEKVLKVKTKHFNSDVFKVDVQL